MPFSYKPLWIKLVQEGMTKEELRVALGFSSATIANMGKDKYVSMESIDKICSYFNVQPNDIIEYVEEPPQE